jgi:hypothetical protein
LHPHGNHSHAGSGSGSAGRLNVILHGLFVFRETPRGIDALIPDMGTEHAYVAGNWLAETPLAGRQTYALKGVNAGKAAQFSRDANIVLRRRAAPATHHGHGGHGVLATLEFPFPSAMVSLGRIPLNPGKDLGGDDKSAVKARAVSTVQVLTYSFDNDAELFLGSHYWEPVVDPAGFVNLHIFSEPQRPPSHGHMRMAFQVSAALVLGSSLNLKRPPGIADLAKEAGSLPQGIHPLEIEDLIQRNRRLQAMGQAIRSGGDAGGSWGRLQGFSGGNPESCPSGLIEFEN